MARKRNDRDELVRCVALARDIAAKALPLGMVPDRRADFDSTELRKIAFEMVLRELLDYETGDK
jgi:hypothetical protein